MSTKDPSIRRRQPSDRIDRKADSALADPTHQSERARRLASSLADLRELQVMGREVAEHVERNAQATGQDRSKSVARLRREMQACAALERQLMKRNAHILGGATVEEAPSVVKAKPRLSRKAWTELLVNFRFDPSNPN